MKIRPLGNRVIVKAMKAEETINGIIVPESAKKKQDCVEVVSVGPGKTNDNGELIPIDISIGDMVMMDKYSGQTITYEDEEYMILNADNIVAVMDKC